MHNDHSVKMHWILPFLQHPHFPNHSFAECEVLFHGKLPIQLHEWLLVCVGKKENQRHAAFFQLQEMHTPLRGKHQVLLWTQEGIPIRIEVDSLSAFRQQVLQFTDHLSFERSTFLVLREKQCLVRLKCVRNLLSLPISPCKPKCELSFRTQTQFIRNMEQIFTSYTRDLHRNYSKEDIQQRLLQDVEMLLQKDKKQDNDS